MSSASGPPCSSAGRPQTFADTIILIAGFEPAELDRLERLCLEGGSKVQRRARQNAPAHVLVCGNVMDPVFRVSERRSGAPR
jgi:hypothetical protein